MSDIARTSDREKVVNLNELLIILFFLVALIYSSAGLAGGSSYLGLLFLFGFPAEQVVVLALIFNIVVSFIGSNFFAATRNLNYQGLTWFLIGSIPAAFLGGSIPIPREMLKVALGGGLLLCSLWILLTSFEGLLKPMQVRKTVGRQLSIGAAIGMLSGLVGIGGGIFLAPILILFQWEEGSKVSGLTSAFILCNSIAGLSGKWANTTNMVSFMDYKWIFAAVIMGGFLGPYLSVTRLSPVFLKRNTGMLILFAGIRLMFEF